MRQLLEQGEEGEGGDEAARQDDLEAADLVRQPAEEDEERRAQQQRGADEHVGGLVVQLQRDLHEEQRVKLAGVPHHALASGGAEEREQRVLVVGVLQEAVAEGGLGGLALGLHLREDGGLVQLQADPDGHGEQQDGHQEGNAPAPVGEGFLGHGAAAGHDDAQAEEEAHGGRGLDPAGVVAAAVMGGVLRHVGRGAAVLTAQGQALQEAQRHHDDGRQPTHRLEGGQQAHAEGGEAHDHDGHEEGVLAPDEVADAPEHQGAEGADQEARRIGREGGQQGGRVVPLGEEQVGEEGRQRGVEVEVVPLEHRPHGGGDDHHAFFLGERGLGGDLLGCDSHVVWPP